jgi:hypothetical protein
MRCVTERLIQVAQGSSERRALEILQVAVARLALRTDKPMSAIVNGSGRALAYARELEEWLDAERR